MSENAVDQKAFPIPHPREEHRWLQRLIGEWTYETSVSSEAGSETQTGTESVRPIGEVWVQAIGNGPMPDGVLATTVTTLGFDPAQGIFNGTWIGSMMHHLWVYRGELDGTGRSLALEAEGPDFEVPGRTRLYRDVITFETDDIRTLTGQIREDDGQWRDMMTVRYRRVG